MATSSYLIPAIRRLPGLINYFAGASPDGSTVNVSVWESDEASAARIHRRPRCLHVRSSSPQFALPLTCGRTSAAKRVSMASDHSVRGRPPRLHTTWDTPHSTAVASLRTTTSGVPMTYRSRTFSRGQANLPRLRRCPPYGREQAAKVCSLAAESKWIRTTVFGTVAANPWRSGQGRSYSRHGSSGAFWSGCVPWAGAFGEPVAPL